MNGEFAMPAEQDILKQREQFFRAAKLGKNEIYCGDDRSFDDDLHLFGGLANPVYIGLVAKEVAAPGSVTESLEEAVAEQVPSLHGAGVTGGVHSDNGNEYGHQISADNIEKVLGCKWLQARMVLSKFVSDERARIIGKSAELYSELFETEADLASAEAIAEAHNRLSERSGFIGSGRAVALRAVEAGAGSRILKGSHAPHSVGILNDEVDTLYEAESAMEAGLPAYAPDMWVAEAAFTKAPQLFPYDKHDLMRGEVIDTVATMIVLGIPEEQIVRRR